LAGQGCFFGRAVLGHDEEQQSFIYASSNRIIKALSDFPIFSARGFEDEV
jgi:hypothetical protein